MAKIFIVPVQVEPGTDSSMPPDAKGAVVSCYSSGDDYKIAVGKVLDALIRDGMIPAEVLQPIHELNVEDWAEHIKAQWPELVDSLLGQSEFALAMEAGEVVYGPFGVY
ncbi:hypothetical protein ABIE09_000487 [Lysobacter enzymogenes]|uniref:hypothetical protein n=1 Tax=Lysobacter enzymogenes TaxID=69 RepID=UPI0033967618